MKRPGKVLAVSLVLFAAAQFVRPERAKLTTDPTRSIRAHPATSAALAGILDRSCGDCHSNTIARRWYTQVAPFSWVMVRGGRLGRAALNFSDWAGYTSTQQQALLVASCADATRGTMPMSAYLWFRPEARLSTEDIQAICTAGRQTTASKPSDAAPGRRDP